MENVSCLPGVYSGADAARNLFFLSENPPAIEHFRTNVDVTIRETEARLRKIFENQA